MCPKHLKEAARLDGANWWGEMVHITIPTVTPVILFTTITGMIWAFQFFTLAYTITGSGPAESTLFYAMYLYNYAFTNFQMGLASAMAWILFIIVALCTLFVFQVIGALGLL